jgi:hypothetical protein
MKLMLMLLAVFSICLSCQADFSMKHDKVYIDEDELNLRNDAFHIHIGDNVWIQTNTVHKDMTGLFTFENSIARSLNKSFKSEYEKKWKCPYCYQYWPIGKKCQNEYCPSKYKDY